MILKLNSHGVELHRNLTVPLLLRYGLPDPPTWSDSSSDPEKFGLLYEWVDDSLLNWNPARRRQWECPPYDKLTPEEFDQIAAYLGYFLEVLEREPWSFEEGFEGAVNEPRNQAVGSADREWTRAQARG